MDRYDCVIKMLLRSINPSHFLCKRLAMVLCRASALCPPELTLEAGQFGHRYLYGSVPMLTSWQILPVRKLMHENVAYEQALGEGRLPHRWRATIPLHQGGWLAGLRSASATTP